MKGSEVIDLIYTTSVLRISVSPTQSTLTQANSLAHFEQTEAKAEFTLNLNRQVTKDKEAAI